VFEAFATKEAAPALTAEDIDEMDALLVQMAQVGRINTYEKWSRLNRTWHFKQYSGAQSSLLLQFLGLLWDRCRLTSNVYARDLSHRDRWNEDHTRIMAAVHAREADVAAGIIANHVRNAMDDIHDKTWLSSPLSRRHQLSERLNETVRHRGPRLKGCPFRCPRRRPA
jgi:DNA-binding GntR family transcriptional regulator